ncbi:MAG: hypothetical protein SWQ30_06595 [Thermodesulfobacteriota bacterium]|nr:hypothetical protein [Thermodesulfobacteriota bacterium]
MEKTKIPQYLKADGKAFFAGVTAEYLIKDTHHIELLTQAAVCVDRISEARRKIQKDGAFVTDRWGKPRLHPGHKVEKDNKSLFLRIVRDLGLDIEPGPGPGRPSGGRI